MFTEEQHKRLNLFFSQNLQSRKKQHLIWRNYRPYPPCNYLHENWSEMNDKIQFMKLTVTSFSYFTSTKMSLVHTTRLGEPARAANTFLDREDDFRGFSTIDSSFILSWRILIIYVQYAPDGIISNSFFQAKTACSSEFLHFHGISASWPLLPRAAEQKARKLMGRWKLPDNVCLQWKLEHIEHWTHWTLNGGKLFDKKKVNI